MNNEEIRNLEITARDRYKGNDSITERAMDEEYITMLKELQDAYKIRNGPKIRDELGTNLTDRERVKLLGECLEELAEEKRCFVRQYISEDLFG